MPSIYIVNPAPEFPTYFSREVLQSLGFGPAAFIADLAITTLAALAPPEFSIRLCDENISPVDYDDSSDFVGITGKVNQFARMTEIAREFRRRGKTVVIGGPYASLSPEMVRPHCDVLVRGEAEAVAPELFADLARGRWKDEYIGEQADLATSPVPRWDLYPNDRVGLGNVQTSRGCPFECEFCDVIQYLGRRQRHKGVGQVLHELDDVYRRGYRNVFLADDNFTVYRSRTKELLAGLRDWNLRREGVPAAFLTQVSIDAAKDPELLRMCSEAGLVHVFIGIETPNEESLKETKKRQNVGVDRNERIARFLENGIAVTAGMILGFDADGPGIFDQQLAFAMESAVPIFTVGALVAPDATPLHARMAREGRLGRGSETIGTPWSTNLQPKRLSGEALVAGIRSLCNRLYDPEAFGERVLRFIDRLGERRDPRHRGAKGNENDVRPVDREAFSALARLPRMGPREERMWFAVSRALGKKRSATELVVHSMLQYLQIRHIYDRGGFWDDCGVMPAA